MKVEEELAPPSAPDEPSTNGSAPSIELPESRGYRLKKRLLGPPLHTEQLEHERLGKPTALAVFAVRQPLVVGVRDRGDAPRR